MTSVVPKDELANLYLTLSDVAGFSLASSPGPFFSPYPLKKGPGARLGSAELEFGCTAILTETFDTVYLGHHH